MSPASTRRSVTILRKSSAARACMRAGISSENSSNRRSGIVKNPKAGSGAAAGGLEPGFAAGAGQIAHPQDVALPLGHRYDAARIEQVEQVARLDALVIGRQRHQVARALAVPAGIEVFAACGLRHAELLEQYVGVGKFEIVTRILLFGLEEYVAIHDGLIVRAAVEIEVHDAVDALQVASEALQAVSQLTRHRRAFKAGDLLEVGELRHLHAVAPALPAEPPGTERRALPVVLDKADVMK